MYILLILQIYTPTYLGGIYCRMHGLDKRALFTDMKDVCGSSDFGRVSSICIPPIPPKKSTSEEQLHKPDDLAPIFINYWYESDWVGFFGFGMDQ